ncbi:hypothetical protein [Nannocystis sp.]|uniref:hypothetical protein n=1 Tax=Nannocystis sp. TaxID=1962667 RepID=UPI0025F803A5|nr:hypothetical protein [Nannocystis sp.]
MRQAIEEKFILDVLQNYTRPAMKKVQVVVEHYRKHVAPLLGGTAKAMVVVSSRIEAVRWQLAVAPHPARVAAARGND